MKQRSTPSTGAIIVQMALFVLVGIPLVAYMWETLNQVLALHFDALRLAIAVPVLAVLIGVLVLMARTIQRWQPPA